MRPVTLGRIGAPHGVRGWVRVQSATRPPEAILEFEVWLIDAGAGPVRHRVIDSRIQSKSILVQLEGCEDRDTVAALRHAEIAVARDDLPPAGPDEWYWADLVGLTVETVDGTGLGHVDHLMETGANDVLVVTGERERLIPWIQGEVVRAVEIEAGRLIVDWDPDF